MRSQRLRVPANPGHERDRSPKRTRPLSPLDPDKRRSLSCPAGRPPCPDPASPVDSFAVPSLRYSGRNRRTVHPSPFEVAEWGWRWRSGGGGGGVGVEVAEWQELKV